MSAAALGDRQNAGRPGSGSIAVAGFHENTHLSRAERGARPTRPFNSPVPTRAITNEPITPPVPHSRACVRQADRSARTIRIEQRPLSWLRAPTPSPRSKRDKRHREATRQEAMIRSERGTHQALRLEVSVGGELAASSRNRRDAPRAERHGVLRGGNLDGVTRARVAAGARSGGCGLKRDPTGDRYLFAAATVSETAANRPSTTLETAAWLWPVSAAIFATSSVLLMCHFFPFGRGPCAHALICFRYPPRLAGPDRLILTNLTIRCVNYAISPELLQPGVVDDREKPALTTVFNHHLS
ncbi:hypothetical protein FQR65_LT20979 [Abscondita terminalis]|nr:hypothetical protein FQR65_LT20979 [Abscondita terminalis]